LLHPKKIRLLLPCITPRKVWNFARLWYSYHLSRWRGSNLHRGNPLKVGFEPTTFCNLRCPECPSGLRSFTRPTGMSDMALFQSVIDQLYRDLVYLLIYFQGEPYLHPNFLDMVAYARKHGIYTATSTNGHYLSEERARQTIESGLSELIVSIDGTTQETYQAYRVGGKLEKVKEGVKRLVAWREKLGKKHPFIILQFLVVRPNEHQIPEVLALGKELGVDKVALKTAQIYDFEQGNELIPTQERYSRYARQADGSYRIKNKLHNQCWKLWQGAEITWDGKVLPCCFDKDAKYEMGSLQEKSFPDIWRSAPYDRFREQILSSRKSIDICQNCTEGTKVWGG
jgi:radical SAM protein with 4Fe4S-binding SPASM domain